MVRRGTAGADERYQLWNVMAAALSQCHASEGVPDPFAVLVGLPFQEKPESFCARVMTLGEEARWPVVAEVAACVWCFYTYFCAVTRHAETALWDAIAAAMHGHPQSLAAFPYLRQLSLVLGAEQSELPGGVDLPAEVARILWAYTEAVTQQSLSVTASAERAWAHLAGSHGLLWQRAMAMAPFVALTGRAPDESPGAHGENRISFNWRPSTSGVIGQETWVRWQADV